MIRIHQQHFQGWKALQQLRAKVTLPNANLDHALVENGNQMAEVEFFQWIPTKMSNWQRVLQQILGIRIRMYISLLQNWHIFMVFSGAPCILNGSHRLAAVCMLYLVICASNTSSSHQDTKRCCFSLGEQVSQGLNR